MLTHALTPAQLPGPEVGAGDVEVGAVVAGALVEGAEVGGAVVEGALVEGEVLGGALVEGTLVGGALEDGGGADEPPVRTPFTAASYRLFAKIRTSE